MSISILVPYRTELYFTGNVADVSRNINGREVIPFEFVSFDKARSLSNSYSLKADAWIFPFMNVFVMLGRISGTHCLALTGISINVCPGQQNTTALLVPVKLSLHP